MPGRIDLHIHTVYSDGLDSPEEVLEIVRRRELVAFSICDHDNLKGYFETKKLLRAGDPELISGVELSAGNYDEDIHILGYFFDPHSALMAESLEEMQRRRDTRGKKMLLKLKKMGIEISYEMVREIAGSSAIARPHIADALLKVGAIRSYESAFTNYIGHAGPAYVAKENLTPGEAIDLIHRAGGLAILAHPGIGGAEKYMEEFVRLGIDGIEVYHPKHNLKRRQAYSYFAEKNSLVITGGSDYHGREGRNSVIGAQRVPYDLLPIMKEKLNSKNRGVT